MSSLTFQSLGLSNELLKAIQDENYTTPTPIQALAIPAILKGGDIMAAAQTGTGKTAGFTLPLLEKLMKTPSILPKPRALILTPTRELAAQVGESVKTYGKYLEFKTVIIFGGVNINQQIKHLRHGADIIIATPGRLLDLISQGFVDLSALEIFVLDEADRMLDMGFIHDIKKVIKLLPKERQSLLFSATFSEDIKKLCQALLTKPDLIEASKANSAAALVTQVVYPVDSNKKRKLLSQLISEGKWKQVLVFTRTKHGANKLSSQLEHDGITSAAIHGNKSQSARTKALADFKLGETRVLVATDIAARGLDIDQLPHVINYELPNVPEDYVHRIGRTGRAGCEGEAISLVCIDEHKLLKDIEKVLRTPLKQVIIPGYEVDPSIKAEPIPNGRQNKPGTAPRQARPGNNQPRGRLKQGAAKMNSRARRADSRSGLPDTRPAKSEKRK